MREVEAPSGQARVHLHEVEHPRAGLILGHGAGGGIAARDLTAVTEVALAEGVAVGLVEQPYRVAGKRSPAPARALDAAWIAVVEALRADELRGLPLIVGGRSAGARVACRTVGETGAAGVLCLAFPLQPPARRSPARAGAAASRLPELDQVKVPMLIVQGATDPFGMPPARRGRRVAAVAGDHSLRSDLDAVRAAVRPWLRRVAGRT